VRARTVFFTLAVLTTANRACSEGIDVNRNVRPILSDKCYFCHGPDRSTQETDLRLDSREAAAEVIEPGELISRILSDDPDVRVRTGSLDERQLWTRSPSALLYDMDGRRRS